MADETYTQQGSAETNASPGTGTGARAGYCQECGQALTVSSLRRVGNGVFCETCASFRQPGSGWQSVPTGAYRPGTVPGTGPLPTGGPNPVLAGVLGFIPGVGAMYNAQYAKGAMHLIVFVILVAMADNLNWVLWWLVWGWIFYQVFDAFHTARARRDNLPLPNPFGWNDIGDRMGFGRAPQGGTPTGAQPGAAPPPGSVGAGSFQTPYTGANWAGYVPPKPASPPPYSPFVEHAGDNPYAAPYAAPGPRPVPPQSAPSNVPYVPTYTGSSAAQPFVVPPPVSGARRFPAGALWLIGLGVIFLLGNLLPELRLSGRWFVPLLLAALGLWSAFRRWELFRSGRSRCGRSHNLPGAMIGPVVLLTVSALLTLQAADVLPLHRSWPVLLVVWGTMLLLQRSAGPVLVPDSQTTPEPVVAPVRSTSGTGSLGL